MVEWDLVDINPSKGKYTRSNKRVGIGHIVARPHHFLVYRDILSQDFLIYSKSIPSAICYSYIFHPKGT
jgi:hypothetical protein